MAADLDILRGLLRRTIASPDDGMRGVLDLRLGRGDLWLALALTIILSVVLVALTQGTSFLLPVGTQAVVVGPMAYGVILGSGLVLMVFAVHFVGRVLGGKGQFVDALAAVVWLEMLGVFLRGVLLVASLFSATAESLVAVLGTIYLIWCLVRFVRVVHEFDGIGRAIGTLLLSFFGITLGLIPLITLIGVNAVQGF